MIVGIGYNYRTCDCEGALTWQNWMNGKRGWAFLELVNFRFRRRCLLRFGLGFERIAFFVPRPRWGSSGWRVLPIWCKRVYRGPRGRKECGMDEEPRERCLPFWRLWWVVESTNGRQVKVIRWQYWFAIGQRLGEMSQGLPPF